MLQLRGSRLRAAGNAASQIMAGQQPKEFVKNQQMQYSFTLPTNEGGQIIDALLSDNGDRIVGSYDQTQLVASATLVAADFAKTGW